MVDAKTQIVALEVSTFMNLTHLPSRRLLRAILGCFTASLLLTACGGGGGGLADLGTENLSGYTGSSSSFVGVQEYRNISQYTRSSQSISSSVHPFFLSNAHKAHEAGLTGQGQTIAVLDTGFNTNVELREGRGFAEIQTKYNSGQIALNGEMQQSPSGHGNAVASIAAARFDGEGSSYYENATGSPYPAFVSDSYPLLNHGIMGIAPSATLHLSDTETFTGLSGIGRATDAARLSGAAVQNNSWGLPGTQPGSVLTLPSALPTNLGSMSASEISQWLAGVTNYSQSDWLSYYQAVKAFQSRGVVVFALQNDYNAARPSILAAFPQVFPDLLPAWIAVGNVDTRGGSLNAQGIADGYAVSRHVSSAPCGAAAPYCLVVDGTQITAAGKVSSAGYSLGLEGTSFAAPQVSGMVALLAQAFPTLRPEQITTRLLATANNRFFTPSASRDFGGGVVHGYNAEFGHGIPDMLAALQPIGASSVVLNGTPETGHRVPLSGTFLGAGPAFGQGFSRAFENIDSQVYDALSAPFKISLSALTRSQARPGYLSLSFTTTSGPSIAQRQLDKGWRSTLGHRNSLLSFSQTLGLSSSGLPNYFSRDYSNLLVEELQSEFLRDSSISDGFMQSPQSFSVGFSNATGRAFMGYAGHSNSRFAAEGDRHRPNVVGFAVQESLVEDPTSELLANLLLGFQIEDDAVRGTSSGGALAFGGGSKSFYLSPHMSWNQGSWRVFLGGSLGITEPMVKADRSVIVSSSPFVSSELYFSAMRPLSPKKALFVKAWQPETIEAATITLSLAGQAATSAQVPIRYQEVSLATRGRPWVLSAGMYQRLNKDVRLTQELFTSRGLGLSSENNRADLGLRIRIEERF